MFFKCVFIENFDSVTKHNGVRYLHHGCFHVQGQHHAGFIRIFNFLFVELAKCFFTHEHAVNDFTSKQRDFRFEDNRLAALGY